ncbi:ATPase [Bailinhaonella thermotolerans]|uniref:ATPase n=2 Tax=Bailinhaonella thermotolerans TaxID=1070861 RepID=A0A3A4ASG3_9ACTN|nr:ATPase [Bailinhaonella thermotolerans]
MGGPGSGLIGREHPAALLRGEVERAVASHGGLVLVAGEAGIGKTTLVGSACEEARRLGALVLGGACWHSDNAPGYWPWTQVLRGLRRGATGEEWTAAEEAGGDGLARVLGEPGGELDADADAFRLSDGVTNALVAVSQRRPVVVVLEDLHWADAASLRLLEFAAQHTWFERVLLVGTYRDAEVETDGHPLGPALLPLTSRATTITLTGLGPAEVGALMARTAGQEPTDAQVAEVHRRTGGNPFFVEQTVRLWRSGGSFAALAPGVRDTLARRLALLPSRVVELLTAAAVIGREFHRQVLAAAASVPVAHADRLLQQAVAARLVMAGEGGTFAFAHDLVRETLYDRLDEEGRAERHAAVARALAEAPGTAEPAELARHAYLAVDRLGREHAVEALLAAARTARRRAADEEAIGHYRRALELTDDPQRRLPIELDLGRQLLHAGDAAGAVRSFDAAAELARELGDPGLLARVALARYQGTAYSGLAPRPDLLREALAALGRPAEGADEQLARDLAFQVTLLARRTGDDETLTYGLWAHHDTIWGPGTAGQRVALTEEILEVAGRTGDTGAEHFAGALVWVAMVENDDPRYLRRFRDYAARDTEPQMGPAVLVDRSIIAAFTGRLDEAERLLDESYEACDAEEHQHLAGMLDQHRWAVLMLQGRFDEAAEVHPGLLSGRHYCPSVLIALTELRRGDTGPALRRLSEGAPRGRIAHGLWLRLLAETAAATADPALCAEARAELRPYLGQWAVSLYGWDLSGPMTLYDGIVAAAQGQWDDAVASLTAATASADRMGARPWAAEARLHLVQALLARAAPGDAAEAARLLAALEPEAAALGMRHVLARLPSVRLALDHQRALVATAPQDAPGSDGRGEAGPEDGDPDPARAAAHPALSRAGAALSGGEVRPAERAAPAVPDGDGRPAAGEAATAVRHGDAGAPAGARMEARTEARTEVGKGEAGPGAGPDSAEAGETASAVSRGETRGGTEPGGGEFRRDGPVWALRYAGRTVHMPDAKGLRDLHYLLGRPGADVPAARLADPEGGETVAAARSMGGDPMLDDEAKARYRRRLEHLDEEIDRAVELGDDRRAAEFDREREALLAELRTAAGLGGRTRRLGDEAERARKTVTARIRDTLRKLDRLHPDLAAHLRGAVSTGATCRYQPSRPTTWRL